MNKKKLLLVVCLLAGLAGTPKIMADQGEQAVPLNVEKIDPTGGDGDHPRTPVLPPHASIDGHTFYVNSSHGDFVVNIVDENDQVVYTTFMPASVGSIELPASLSGNYTIQLYWSCWLFYGDITL